MEKFIIEQYQLAMHCYFWVFIIWVTINILVSYSEDYKENKRNKIKNGTWGKESIWTYVVLTLWAMSWYYI